MASFKLTDEQQKFVEMAEQHFDARCAQEKHQPSAFSHSFLERCSTELGIAPPRQPRVHFRHRKLFGALDALFGHDNWLIRLFRRR